MSNKQSKDQEKPHRSSGDRHIADQGSAQQSGNKGGSEQSGNKGGSQQSGNKGGSQQSGMPGSGRQDEHEDETRDVKRQSGQNTPGRKVDNRPE
jgi:hypothetical protein